MARVRAIYRAGSDQPQMVSYTAQEEADADAAEAISGVEAARVAGIRANASRADLLNRLRTATDAQIDTWLGNNVTNLAQARAVLGAIIKVIALLDVRE